VVTNIIPDSSINHARFRARERREWLLQILAETKNSIPNWIVEETPPETRSSERLSISDFPAELYGQLARLRWQLSSEALLLLERVTDAVLQILDVRSNSNFPRPIAVKLAFSGARQGSQKFPWRVIVCSFERERLQRGLAPLADWFGIGVDIDEPTFVTPLGRCLVGYDAKFGLVGGILRYDEPYAVTCGHVISSSCNSTSGHLASVHTLPYSGVTSIPDAVLLQTNTPCFEVPDEAAEPVSAALPSWVEHCILARVPVRQSHPNSQSHIAGRIKTVVSVSTIGEQLYRFPQSEIIPRSISYFFGLLKFPLFKRYFSYPGDSGAWVREAQSGAWIGMVTAGDDHGSTYLSDAHSLARYFGLLANNSELSLSTTWPNT